MGVNGLWRLLEPSGKPVPVESLENQVLAVDVSIWLHQATKGFQDASGNALPNAHLLGLFHRLCKLLFYKIKPVFVFDGGVPPLKRQTVAARRQQKSKAEQTAERMREQLLRNLIKHKAVKNVLGGKAWQAEVSMPRVHSEDDMFQLPPATPTAEEDSGSESADDPAPRKHYDLHSIDVKSAHFRSLPADMRHDILVELKETRKQSSWGRLHQIPKASGDFSSYQMKRLLTRRSVQVSLEETEKEMGGKTLSLGELEELMTEHGIITESDLGKRIASDSTTRFIFINGSKVEASTSKAADVVEKSTSPSSSAADGNIAEVSGMCKTGVDESAILETIQEDEYDEEFDTNEWDTEFTEKEYKEDLSSKLQVAKDFMFENSGLTQEQILAIIKTQNSPKKGDWFGAMPSTSQLGLEEHITAEKSDALMNVITDERKEAHVSIVSTDSVNVTEKSKSEWVATVTDEESVSDCDAGFVEVEDVPPCVFIWDGSEQKAAPLEVVIQPDKINMEEDIFADVFSKNVSGIESSGEPSKATDLEHTEYSDQTVNIVGTKNNNSKSLDNNYNDSKIVDIINHVDEVSKNVNNMKDKCSKIVDNLKTNEEGSVKYEAVKLQTDALNTMSECMPSSVDGRAGNVREVGAVRLPAGTLNTLSEHVPASVDGRGGNVREVGAVRLPAGTLNSVSADSASPPQASSPEDNTRLGSDMETEIRADEVITEDEDKDEQPKVVSVQVQDAMTPEELQRLQSSLEQEHNRLMTEKGRQDRLAASITDQMYTEAQELLQLFGVPYIIAPMEAEAQCAFLDAISLTDGTITDDSDIWLFGGQQVYKNFFNQKKHVMKFRAVDIQHYFKLARQQMILLALLVGSDYTVGLQGIGPVTALEILAAFPPGSAEEQDEERQLLCSLQKFRDWWSSGKAAGPSKAALRNKVKDIKLHADFPSIAVVEAYLRPNVDDSKEKFSWSTPDLAALRMYAMEKFGWPQTKTDSILLPVMKKLDEKNNQQTLDSYIQRKPKLPLAEGKLSKRVQSAVGRLGTESGSSSESESPAPKVKRTVREASKRGRGRGARGGRGRSKPSGAASTNPLGAAISSEFILQREKDKLNSLNRKLKAIEVFRTSKAGLDRTKRQKRVRKEELVAPNLSESSGSD